MGAITKGTQLAAPWMKADILRNIETLKRERRKIRTGKRSSRTRDNAVAAIDHEVARFESEYQEERCSWLKLAERLKKRDKESRMK